LPSTFAGSSTCSKRDKEQGGKGRLLVENLPQEWGRGGMGHKKTAKNIARSENVGLVEIVPPLMHVEFL